MKCKKLLPLLFAVLAIPVLSQTRLITCRSERNKDHSISIFAESIAYGDYTVKFTFTGFAGYSLSVPMYNGNVALATAYTGIREIMRLTPVLSSGNFAMQYRYNYFPGAALQKKPDTSFVYLLPGTENTPLRISRVTSIVERLGQKPTDEFTSIGFIYRLGDTICAARAGMVYHCSDEAREGEKVTEFFTRKNRNSISIQHKDGTLGHYEMLAPIHLLVAPGDYVIPGQPLAVFNKESDKYHLLFSVSYLDQTKVSVDNSNTDTQTSPYSYLPTLFYLDENNRSATPELRKQYTTLHPKEIIGAEMSKKEKKKLGL
jgi:hypothetical protein